MRQCTDIFQNKYNIDVEITEGWQRYLPGNNKTLPMTNAATHNGNH